MRLIDQIQQAITEAVAKTVEAAKTNVKYSEIPDIVFSTMKDGGIESVDNGTYIEWILNRYLKMDADQKSRFIEDLPQIKSALVEFTKKKNKGYWRDPKDINQYKTVADLYTTVGKYEGQKTKNDLKVSSKDVDQEDIETIYDDGTWSVKVPKTREASCILGRGTHWCTASQGASNMYNHYTSGDYLGSKLYVISNGENKWQYHPESNQIMNEQDKDSPEVFDKMPIKLFKLFIPFMKIEFVKKMKDVDRIDMYFADKPEEYDEYAEQMLHDMVKNVGYDAHSFKSFADKAKKRGIYVNLSMAASGLYYDYRENDGKVLYILDELGDDIKKNNSELDAHRIANFLQAAVKSTNPKFLDYALSKGLKPSKYVLTEKGLPLENVKKVIDSGVSLEGEYNLLGSIFNYLIQSGGFKNLEVLAYYMEKYPETVAKIKLGEDAISRVLRTGKDIFGVYDFVIKNSAPGPEYLGDAIYGGEHNIDVITTILDAGASPNEEDVSRAVVEFGFPDDLFYRILGAADCNMVTVLNMVLGRLGSVLERNIGKFEKRAGAIIGYIESHMKEVVASVEHIRHNNPIPYLRQFDMSVQKDKMLSDEFKNKLYNCVYRLDTYSKKNESLHNQTNYYLL